MGGFDRPLPELFGYLEFTGSWTHIAEGYGRDAPERLAYAGAAPAVTTDDTQMTLFVAEGFIRAVQRFRDRGICHAVSVIRGALLRWYATQVRGVRLSEWQDNGWLVRDVRLHHRRAPGNTNLAALAAQLDTARLPSIRTRMMAPQPLLSFGRGRRRSRRSRKPPRLIRGGLFGDDVAPAWKEVVEPYPGELLAQLAEFYHAACIDLGLRQYSESPNDPIPVTTGINQAWQIFRDNPDAFSEFEPSMLAALVAQL